MPTATALFVKSAWLWFLGGIALGLVIALHKAFGWWEDRMALIFSTHVHMLLVGFVAQWIMGIAYWFYPRVPGTGFAPRHRAAIVAWGLLNAGILLRAAAEALYMGTALRGWAWVYLASVLLQAAGGVLFVLAIWGRIWCSLRLPEGRVSEPRLLAAARTVLAGKEVP